MNLSPYIQELRRIDQEYNAGHLNAKKREEEWRRCFVALRIATLDDVFLEVSRTIGITIEDFGQATINLEDEMPRDEYLHKRALLSRLAALKESKPEAPRA